jgi:hypothetical protein
MNTRILDEMEHRLAVGDLTLDAPEIAEVGHALAREGTMPVIAGIVLDETQPEPARWRALGRAIHSLRAVDARSRRDRTSRLILV